MFKSNQAHIFLNEDRIASKSDAVVLFNTQREDYRVRRFIGAALLAVSLGIVSLQANWVYNAQAEDAPVTSPVTSEESPSPSASPSSAPITSPIVSPSPSANPSSGGGSNGGNSGGGSSNSTGSVGAPSCNNEAPKSAPKIISAVKTGANEITLTWEKVQNPVTHYVIAYGFIKGQPIYGNPNVGNVNSYKVKGLAGGVTYYFKVRGGNDCMPGAYSQEIGVKVGGKFINSPAQGFKSGVLGKTIKKNMPLASVIPTPAALSKPQIETNSGLFGKVFSFLSNIFKP